MSLRYLNFWAGETLNGKSYVYGGSYEGIYEVDLIHGTCGNAYIGKGVGLVNENLEASSMHYNIAFRYDNEIWYIPAFECDRILIFNTVEHTASYITVPQSRESWMFRAYYIFDGYVWLFPYSYGQILKISLKNRIIEYSMECSDHKFLDGVGIGNKFFLCSEGDYNKLYLFDMIEEKLSDLALDFADEYVRIREYQGKLLLLHKKLINGIMIYDTESHKCINRSFNNIVEYDTATEIAGCVIDGDNIYLSTNNGDESILVLNGFDMNVTNIYRLENQGEMANYCYDLKLGDDCVFCPINPKYPAIVLRDGMMNMHYLVPQIVDGLKLFLNTVAYN